MNQTNSEHYEPDKESSVPKRPCKTIQQKHQDTDEPKVLTSVDHVQNRSEIGDFWSFFVDFSELSRLPTYKNVVIECQNNIFVPRKNGPTFPCENNVHFFWSK